MAKPAPFPHHYTVTLADGLLSSPPREPIALGPPPQFGGTDRVWSPEELLVGAVLECLWTTFDAYARHDALEVHGWSGSGVGVLEKGSPVPVFSSIALSVELVVAAADEERARRVLTTAEQHCIISNALKVPVTLQATVRAG
ncbi:hypothetical protein BH11MYX1_BH11MYX1_11690 [soil metagenome]